MRQETLELLAHVCNNLNTVASMVRSDTDRVVASNDHVEVIRHYDSLRNVTQKIKVAREALDQIEMRLSREQVPDVMDRHGVRTITVEGVGRVSLADKWSCSMVDKWSGIDWLRANGHGDLVQETVNSSTLGAFARNLSEEEGFDLPSDLFKTSVMTYTSITKA